jgi:hypothetical protein
MISKLHRNVKHYEWMCRLLSEFSKWSPLPWKPQKNTKKFKVQSVTNVPQTNNTSTSGMNEE